MMFVFVCVCVCVCAGGRVCVSGGCGLPAYVHVLHVERIRFDLIRFDPDRFRTGPDIEPEAEASEGPDRRGSGPISPRVKTGCAGGRQRAQKCPSVFLNVLKSDNPSKSSMKNHFVKNE